MILSNLFDNKLIIEDHGHKLYFDYTKIRKKREIITKPVVLYLGTWDRKLKNGKIKKFWCGIDMNQLDNEQLSSLQYNLPEILKSKKLYNRYWAGKKLLPDIFVDYYRTYSVDSVGSVMKGRLFSLKITDRDKEEAPQLSAQDGEDYDSLPLDIKNYYLAKAVRERGEKEAEEQQQSAIEKDEEPPRPKKKEKKEKKKKKKKKYPEKQPEIKPPAPMPKIVPQPARPTIRQVAPVTRPEMQPKNVQSTKHSLIQPDQERLNQEIPQQDED